MAKSTTKKLAQAKRLEHLMGYRCPECEGEDTEEGVEASFRCRSCDHQWDGRDFIRGGTR